MTQRKCSIFLNADPFMNHDVEAIRSALQIYSHVDIILDRKWQRNDYLLSFADRCDIINHDLKAAGITQYEIVPNDTSRFESAMSHGSRDIVIEYNRYSSEIDIQKRVNLTKGVIPDVNVYMIPQFGDDIVSSHEALFDMVMEDPTRTMYKKHISDYAYLKVKSRLLSKICITGNFGCDFETVLDVFRDRGYEVFDVDSLIQSAFQDKAVMTPAFMELERLGIRTTQLTKTRNGHLAVEEAAVLRLCLDNPEAREVWFGRIQDYVKLAMTKRVMQTKVKTIVVACSLVFELNIENNFQRTICLRASPKTILEGLVRKGIPVDQVQDYVSVLIPNQNKTRMTDAFIDVDGSEDDTRRNTINLINRRLEIGF